MDVVALAQHGVELRGRHARHVDHARARAEALPAHRYASSSASTATPRAARPRGARSRTRCRCSPTARTRAFLFLPDGEDPGRLRAPARQARRSRRRLHKAPCRCPSSCSPSSRAQHPPTSAEGAARWSRPHGRIVAPDRRRRCSPRCCSERLGRARRACRKREIASLLGQRGRRRRAARATPRRCDAPRDPRPPARRARPCGGRRRSPGTHPGAAAPTRVGARRRHSRQPDDGTPEAAALCRAGRALRRSERPLTTAGVLQAFRRHAPRRDLCRPRPGRGRGPGADARAGRSRSCARG